MRRVGEKREGERKGILGHLFDSLGGKGGGSTPWAGGVPVSNVRAPTRQALKAFVFV